MEVRLPEFPASAGPAAAWRLRTLRDRAATSRAELERELEAALTAFEAAFEKADRKRNVRDRISDAARSQTQRVPR